MMKRIMSMAAVLWLLSSCMPQAYSLCMDVKYPSESGLDLSGKTVSVVCLDEGVPEDSSFLASFGDGLAQGIEKAYTMPSDSHVDVYSFKKTAGGDYSVKDSLLAVLMAVNTDVVLLVDSPQNVTLEDSRIKCSEDVYIYDSMCQNDTVVHLRRFVRIQDAGGASSLNVSDAQYFGYGFSDALRLNWRQEIHPVFFYEGVDSRWISALSAAADMDWQKALDIWLGMVDVKSADKRACVCYNIGLACYLMDNFDVALKWLEKADAANEMRTCAELRRKIVSRMPKTR